MEAETPRNVEQEHFDVDLAVDMLRETGQLPDGLVEQLRDREHHRVDRTIKIELGEIALYDGYNG